MEQHQTRNYFVTGIDTDSGKSVVCALLTQMVKADYWKPIQAGRPTDSEFIRANTENVKVHPEGIMLKYPMSPHASAILENKTISLDQLEMPKSNNSIIIEGAGGIMVPINDTELVIDIAYKFNLEVILVSRIYLGSINHTLLSIDYLKKHGFNIKGIVFNGERNSSTEDYIINYSGLDCLFKIDNIPEINSTSIKQLASTLKF